MYSFSTSKKLKCGQYEASPTLEFFATLFRNTFIMMRTLILARRVQASDVIHQQNDGISSTLLPSMRLQ